MSQKESYVIQSDGNAWCATGKGFCDLQSTRNYAFGDTPFEALLSLIDLEDEAE